MFSFPACTSSLTYRRWMRKHCCEHPAPFPSCQLACFGHCHKSVEHRGLRCPFPSFASWEEAARGGGEGKAGPRSKPVAWLGFHSSSPVAPRSQPALRRGLPVITAPLRGRPASSVRDRELKLWQTHFISKLN